jgi:hypothetical protein
MSAIFETEFPDYLVDNETNRTKASTAKLVLLAIADHANDEGESAYPGLTRLEIKTGLSRQGIIDTIGALKYNGILTVADEPSKLNTNNYSINTTCFPRLVNPLDQSTHLTIASQATLPELVKPLDLKHPLTTIESSFNNTSTFKKSPDDSLGAYLDMLKGGQAKNQPYVEVIERLSKGLHLNLPPYGENKVVDHVAHMIALAEANHPDQTVEVFCAWATANKDAKELSWYRIKPDGIYGDWLLPYVPEKPSRKNGGNGRKTSNADFMRQLTEA